jgi:hypothetical protein
MDFALRIPGRTGGRPQRIGGLSDEEVLVPRKQVHRREPPLPQVRPEIVVAESHRPIIREQSLDNHAEGSGRTRRCAAPILLML